LATHGNTERKLTLEVVRREADPSLSRLSRVRAKIVSRASDHVAHRGLVEALETGSDGGREWVALELMRGETLAKRLESGPLEPAVLRFVFTRLLEIVEHVHRAGIVHCHLAPERVFLEETAAGLVRVRLLDFELVQQGEQLLGTHSSASAVVVVPRAYQAPEQRAANGVVSVRSDVFALGAVLLACLSSQRPLDLARLAARTAAGTGEPAIALDDPALEPYVAVAGYCLAFDPARRPSSCADLRRLFSMGGSRPPPLPRPVAEPVHQGRRRGWLRVGALVLVGLVLALFLRSVVPASLRPAAEPHDDESSSRLRPTPQEGSDQTDSERAEETSGRAEAPSEEATQESSEEATQESSEEATQESSEEPPVEAAEPSLRPGGRYESEQIFASTEQRTLFADTRRTPRRSERSYRLDVEGAPITRSDGSTSPRAKLSVHRVRDTLRRSAAQLERCCDAALRASLLRAQREAPQVAPAAELRVHGLAAWFSVAASGATSSVRLEGDAPDELLTCIRGSVQHWKLPGLEVGAEFRVGLVFAGASAPIEGR
jgi:serine/threonine protein kinase